MNTSDTVASVPNGHRWDETLQALSHHLLQCEHKELEYQGMSRRLTEKEEECQGMSRRLTEKEEECQEVQRQLSSMQKAFNELRRRGEPAEVARLKNKTEMARKAFEQKHIECVQLKSAYQSLVTEKTQLQMANQSLHNSLQAAQVQWATANVSNERAGFTGEISLINSERMRLKAERDDLATRIELLRSERDDLAVQVDAIASERAEVATRAEATLAEKEEVTTRLRALTSEKDDLSTRIQTLTQERDNLSTRIQTLTDEKDDLATRVDAITLEKDGLATRVDAITLEKDGLVTRAEDLMAKNHELSARVDQLVYEKDVGAIELDRLLEVYVQAKEILTCKICLHLDPSARILSFPCGHIICQHCKNDWRANDGPPNPPRKSCPFCRADWLEDPKPILALPDLKRATDAVQKARHTQRRKELFARRRATTKRMMEAEESAAEDRMAEDGENNADTPGKQLDRMLSSLTEDGMSSDESDGEGDMVKINQLKWRSEAATRALVYLDNHALSGPSRQRVAQPQISRGRPVVVGMPGNMYEEPWYNERTEERKAEINAQDAIHLPTGA
ncbi:hypothetical protein ONZ45_g7939 [Pleurotus djamor]|nr:hypothetical protein ONZ45_g7939 [Pleurotus djamor]